ncbi:F-box associated interaction domain-containing protein [Artemisia annua]|uniref:F-box associated interaction domain-containing protein n=1 Tax=Artemisia annua TaxID=35608 RepID=A0A2U1P299_ARTAN|nr:F-box associated interaction domain-containing protein [Artemisia annua]
MSYFCCRSAIPPFKIHVHVYSLRSITWKQVTDSPYDHYDWESYLRWSSGVFVNGFIHWIASKGSDSIQVIAAFSLAEEKFISEVPSPDLYNDVDILSDKDCELVALGEKLAIFHSVKGSIWLMNEYGVQKSWTKIVVSEYSRFLGVEPMIFYDKGKIMIEALRRMWMYDLEEQTFCKRDDFKILNLRRVISTCVESLVSPELADPINYRQLQAQDGGWE